MLIIKALKYKFLQKRAQKKASYPHHTATTAYLCCVPALEDSAGAGCVGLAGRKDTMF